MKRILVIIAIALLLILVLYACRSTIRTGSTSFVTITIGGYAGTARLHAEAATPWSTFKYFLAGVQLVPDADAYVPSLVQVLVVTVSAPDMTTIVAVDDVSNKTSTSITLEVPNGSGRTFTVDGVRGTDSQTYYRGSAVADLDGTDVTLPITMNFTGPGILVDNQHPAAADLASCGTTTQPCLTISYALNTRSTGSDAILVSAGSYSAPVGAAGNEVFPLQLKPGTALVCLGPAYSTVIDQSQSAGMVAIYGNEGASIDNCQIIPAGDGRAVEDQAGGVTPARTKINGILVPTPPLNNGAWEALYLTADSVVVESQVLGSNNFGIEVVSGRPVIKGCTISNNPVGIEISGGDPTIVDSTISLNTTGLETVSTGTPLIQTTIFDGNSTGLLVGDGSPQISGSTFTNNSSAGLDIVTGSPRVVQSMITKNFDGIVGGTGTTVVQDSSLFCNTFFNLSTSITATMDVRFNTWEHSPPLVDGLGAGTNCLQGDDICANGPAVPDFSGYRAAAPGTCTRLPAKPLTR